MILNKTIETMPTAAKLELQGRLLHTVVERIYEKTSFYEQRLQALSITPADIHEISALRRLPFTTAEDLMTLYPFGLLTMPVSGIARFEKSPLQRITTGFTTQDLHWQYEMIARSLVACDVTTTSTLLVLSDSLSAAAVRSLQQSAEMLGVTVIAEQPGTVLQLLATIEDFSVTTLCGSPSKLLAVANFLCEHGVAAKQLPIMNLLCEAQACSPVLQNELAEIFARPVYTLYGRHDVMSLGIAGSCHQQYGLHLHDDHFYPEIIHPATDDVLPDGQTGELVLTTLSREATPLLRYKTGQTACLTYERCACGRTSPRLFFTR